MSVCGASCVGGRTAVRGACGCPWAEVPPCRMLRRRRRACLRAPAESPGSAPTVASPRCSSPDVSLLSRPGLPPSAPPDFGSRAASAGLGRDGACAFDLGACPVGGCRQSRDRLLRRPAEDRLPRAFAFLSRGGRGRRCSPAAGGGDPLHWLRSRKRGRRAELILRTPTGPSPSTRLYPWLRPNRLQDRDLLVRRRRFVLPRGLGRPRAGQRPDRRHVPGAPDERRKMLNERFPEEPLHTPHRVWAVTARKPYP